MTKTKIEKLTRERDRERVCFCSQFTYFGKKEERKRFKRRKRETTLENDNA